MNYPELEIGLYQRNTATYAAQVRFHDPEQEGEPRADLSLPVQFDFDQLSKLATDPEDPDLKAYGLLLGQNLFGLPEARSCLDKARAVSQTTERPLRLRLYIERWSLLHNLRWETLRDPETGHRLVIDQSILFSRHLGSYDMRPVRLRSKTDLRALVAIACPSDLESWKPDGRTLVSIDIQAELDRARDSLVGIAVTELGGAQHVTLDAIIRHLRDNDFDVLYLVCHGALLNKEPQLWLEGENGSRR